MVARVWVGAWTAQQQLEGRDVALGGSPVGSRVANDGVRGALTASTDERWVLDQKLRERLWRTLVPPGAAATTSSTWRLVSS